MISVRRRKGFFTAIFLTSCFFYFNWLLNISDLTDISQVSLNINAKQIKKRHDDLHVFEVIEGYDLLDQSNKNKEHFILLASKETKADKLINEGITVTNDKKLTKAELNSVFDLFYKNEVFLIDVNLLKNIKIANDESESSSVPQFQPGSKLNKIKAFDTIDNYLNNPEADLSTELSYLITFGVNYKSFDSLNRDLVENLNPSCKFKQMTGSYVKENVLTSLYVECKQITLQISVFYERGSFYWIGSDAHSFKNKKKVFGDKPRAMNSFESATATDELNNKFLIPADIEKILFDYDHSTFLECNHDLAKQNLERMGPSYKPNLKRNKMITPVVQHLADTLETNKKHYWLAGGTLLGWYRDCGVIPHTQDVDLAIWAHEYDKKIKKHFLGNKIVRVWGTLGLINDSYEFRLYNDLFTFDMFLVYKINQTHQWCGYQVNRVKFRRFLPNFDELCSAELLNNKFMVPCDPVNYLDKEYGPKNWQTPQSKNYSWTNVLYWKNWTDAEWPHTIKYYGKSGELLTPKILAYVNKHLSYNLTSLPPDDVD